MTRKIVVEMPRGTKLSSEYTQELWAHCVRFMFRRPDLVVSVGIENDG